jgi:hypothetical protein
MAVDIDRQIISPIQADLAYKKDNQYLHPLIQSNIGNLKDQGVLVENIFDCC